MKLQYKIALMIFGFGTLFIVGISSLSYIYKRSDYINRLRAELSDVAGERAEHVDVDVKSKVKVVATLSNVPIIEEALERSNSEFKVRTVLPLVVDGNTVAINVWFD